MNNLRPAISTGPYTPCGLRADSLWAHPDGPDGISYQSRHDSGEICVALFERDDMRFAVDAATPFSAPSVAIAGMLDSHGKSPSPGAGP
ncbi:RES family NAD+ phosphorylase [Neorhizobium petrolearium]|uniref:RES family NAD+ phosphorylase n=1 Tax=Neorhizobium petrolearium TaxID=515361 RepID=A0ABY8M8Z9_9HYPH|nr:RES family NAD+ phosphorylase [Neorhizobium petrolearium]MCC2610884.1 RES family NAD+ phosphorylase [Neorhizobium petrolearium]WGI70998.1 RES family NAD+ phosphorylase [Neorhizobium petrolearium]